MRTAFGLALVLLAGCDASAPDSSPLVGTWVLAASESETRVTSRVDQSIPDYSARGEGGIEVSGAVTARLDYVFSVSRQAPGFEQVTVATTPGPTSGPTTSFGIRRGFADGATLNVSPGGGGIAIRYDAEGDIAFSYQDGLFTIPAVDVLADDGSGATARIGGTLRLPLLALAANQETVIERSSADSVPARVLTLRADGTFSQAEPGLSPSTGTWVADETSGIELRFGGVPPDDSFQPRLTYQLASGTLRLTYANDAGCTLECVSSYAADRFAPSSSLSRVRTVMTETYRRTTP